MSYRNSKSISWIGALLLVLAHAAMTGCSQPKGIIFKPLAEPLVWPSPPESPRIQFVGSLRTDKDLKPAKSFTKKFSESLFGKKSAHSMLTPYALTSDGHGRIFACDSNAQVIHVFDLNTRRYEQWKPDGPPSPDGKIPSFAQPVGIAYDGRDRLLVTDAAANRIYVFDSTGHAMGTIADGLLDKPSGIAVDPETNRIFIANTGTHQVLVLSPEGVLIRRIGHRGTKLGEFNFPTNLAISHHGLLYVSDTLNFRVQVFDRNLNPIRQVGQKGDLPGYFSHPKGIAVDSQDHLYVIDAHFESVQIFDDQGRLLLTFGEEGHTEGQFWLPTGIYIDQQDQIWIADSYNQRLEVFAYLAEEQQ